MNVNSKQTEIINELTKKNAILQKENEQLKLEKANLERKLAQVQSQRSLHKKGDLVNQYTNSILSAKEKVKLFRDIFKGREDLYAIRWSSKDGKFGYAAACRNEWVRELCKKPCHNCLNRDLLPLTDQVIYDHLAGKKTIGIYPLLLDDRCYFLAVDFDEGSYQSDALAYLNTAYDCGIKAYLEISRSGKGCHVWIFFTQPIEATQARKLGELLLVKSQENTKLNLKSFDRMFPNQDTLPKGGFGNLIALPLQLGPRKQGFSVFVNRDFQPYPDQWHFLEQVEKNSKEKVIEVINQKTSMEIVDLGQSLLWNQENQFITNSALEKVRLEKLPDHIEITISNMIYIKKEALSQKLISLLKNLATFANPEFYKAQKMRLSTFGKPRFISCVNDYPNFLALPRGCFESIIDICSRLNIKLHIIREQQQGKTIKVNFLGELVEEQQSAVEAILKFDTGILAATTGFGKTVVGASIIAQRGVNTLILVHRKQLLEQWKERLIMFLDISEKDIGQIGGGKRKPLGRIDLALIQSLYRKNTVDDLVLDYGQIIVDECHHISAYSFEQVLMKAKARFILGLTATPFRRDGLEPIIMMECGPIRYEGKRKLEQSSSIHLVFVRQTNLIEPEDSLDWSIQKLYAYLLTNNNRNELIVSDIISVLKEGRTPLILTERKAHIDILQEKLKGHVAQIIVLRSESNKKERAAVSELINSKPEKGNRVIIATGKLIGEGFDCSYLDTLFLTLPISWKGTLQQYVGRLHRQYEGKKKVVVYDYCDGAFAVLKKMYQKRLKGYEMLGYEINESQLDLFETEI